MIIYLQKGDGLASVTLSFDRTVGPSVTLSFDLTRIIDNGSVSLVQEKGPRTPIGAYFLR